MRKARIGISIALQPDTNIWNSGHNQNLFFLAQLFSRSPAVQSVCLINMGSGTVLPDHSLVKELGLPVVKPQDVTHGLDLVIEMGASLPLEWLHHVRALGTRVAGMLVGHTYLSQAEDPMFERSGTIMIGTPWDELWTLPSFMKTSAPLLRTVARAPVVAMPHIWSPAFLQGAIEEAAQAGRPFGFKPDGGAQRRPWRAAIFEPNLSVGKNCFIPMLVCESAYRDNRDALDLMMVLNTFHMKEHSTFNAFAVHLDLTRDHKASYEPRLPFVQCMTEHRIDAVVSHQWEWGLNYVYYDALHGGYPLVHNSEYLRDAGLGFFYPGFSARQGGKALIDAWSREPAFWEGYRANAAEWLRALDPIAPANVKLYTDQVVRLLGDRLAKA